MKISLLAAPRSQRGAGGGQGHGMYVNSSMAKVEALKAGYDEAILLSPQGYVSECTGENLFIVKHGRLLTPPVSAGALEGITQRLGGHHRPRPGLRGGGVQPAPHRPLPGRGGVPHGTAAEIVPIRSVDDREIGEPGPITRAIQETYFATVRGEIDRYKDWLELVRT